MICWTVEISAALGRLSKSRGPVLDPDGPLFAAVVRSTTIPARVGVAIVGRSASTHDGNCRCVVQSQYGIETPGSIRRSSCSNQATKNRCHGRNCMIGPQPLLVVGGGVIGTVLLPGHLNCRIVP